MNKTKLKKLKKALDNHLDAVRDIFLKDRLLKDMEFHMTLAQLSGNLEDARNVLAGHIANVKHHAISSTERMNREKNAKI